MEYNRFLYTSQTQRDSFSTQQPVAVFGIRYDGHMPVHFLQKGPQNWKRVESLTGRRKKLLSRLDRANHVESNEESKHHRKVVVLFVERIELQDDIYSDLTQTS